jgi:sugar-specific transcriptional regulator TrmB
MPDMTTIQQQVAERLRELEEQIEALSGEFEQLKQIAAMLESPNGAAQSGSASRRPAARRQARTAKTATQARSGRGGNRAQQALELIGAQPGATAAELAELMGMKRNYLYRVLPALEKDGKITKQGKGYHLAATA